MAQEITQRNPNSASFKLTCGLAYYRARRHAEAVQVLEEAQRLYRRPRVINYFGLAMAYHALGQVGKARENFNLGLKRMQIFPEASRTKIMRDEAARVIGVDL